MRVLLLLVVVLCTACDGGNEGDSTAATETPGDTQTTAAATAGGNEPGSSPCELLTEDMVRRALEPGDVEITSEPGTTNQSAYCQYRWSVPLSAEEEQARNDAAAAWMMARIEARASGEEPPERPTFPSLDGHVFFNLLKPFNNAQQAASAFDAMAQRLREGIQVETEAAGTVEFKGGDSIQLEGIGDKALWDPKLSQVSVVSGPLLFHLKVSLPGDQDPREAAERLAAELVQRL